MSIFPSDENEIVYDFPDVNSANKYGLLAIGGNLSFGTLMNAYQNGIFPWYNPGEMIQWYCPDPRFVLFPEKIKISRSMKNVFNKNIFKFTTDEAFPEVIHHCRMAKRAENNGTWISDEIEIAYTGLYKKGFAHSAEAWENNQLVGGLYGVLLGKVFFGESMFSDKSNASKFAFINWIKKLQEEGIELVDCQVYTPHLESLGAQFISRNEFISILKNCI